MRKEYCRSQTVQQESGEGKDWKIVNTHLLCRSLAVRGEGKEGWRWNRWWTQDLFMYFLKTLRSFSMFIC